MNIEDGRDGTKNGQRWPTQSLKDDTLEQKLYTQANVYNIKIGDSKNEFIGQEIMLYILRF